jgi:hypothetical protein
VALNMSIVEVLEKGKRAERQEAESTHIMEGSLYS